MKFIKQFSVNQWLFNTPIGEIVLMRFPNEYRLIPTEKTNLIPNNKSLSEPKYVSKAPVLDDEKLGIKLNELGITRESFIEQLKTLIPCYQ